MKRFLIALAIIVVGGVLSIPLVTRILGPRIIFVSPPTGQPIGEFDHPRPETSLLAVNIAVPLSMMSQLANEKAPEKFSGTGQNSIHKRIQNSGYAWEAARGPIEFQNTGQNLAVATLFEGVAEFSGELDAKFIRIPLRSNAQIGGTIGGTMSPVITPDWQINPQFTPQINLSKAVLTLGQLGSMDVSDLLGGSLGQYVQKEAGKLAPALGKSLNLRKEIDTLWQQAYLSRLISDDPRVWVSVTPQAALLAPINFSQPDQISLTVGIQAETLITNREPSDPVPSPLPNVTPLEGVAPTNLQLPIVVSVTELNEVLSEENMDFDTGIGTQIEVKGMEARIGQGGLLNLKVDLQADKSRLGRGVAGEIWLKARPVIDFEEQSLGFTNVELTVETRDKLTTAATWLVEGLLVKAIESQLRVDLDDYKAEINEEVQKGLQNADLPDGIDVSLKNLDINLADIYTVTRQFPDGDPDPGVVIVIQATGDMETTINEMLLKRSDTP